MDSESFEGGVVVFSDITERAQQQEELARSNHDLKQFAYAAAHDLREPLRQVMNFGRLLSEETSDQLDAEQRDWLRIMREGAQRMDKLTLGLLAYTRAADREVMISSVDTRFALDWVLADLATVVESSGATVEIGELPHVRVDDTLLRQLLQNLISNAIKYAGESPPQIRISAQPQGALTRISVADSGIGIAPQHQDRVFRIFQRLHTQQEIEGSGIGLALCRRIAQRWDGEVWLESEVGQGTTVHFTVPKDLDK